MQSHGFTSRESYIKVTAIQYRALGASSWAMIFLKMQIQQLNDKLIPGGIFECHTDGISLVRKPQSVIGHPYVASFRLP
jgi:hypothetical protein